MVERSHPENQRKLFEEAEVWTYTKLKSLRRCPLEFKVRFLDKQEALFQPSGLETVMGRTLHTVLLDYFRESDTPHPYKDLLSIYDSRKPKQKRWLEDPLNEQRVLQALRLFADSRLARARPIATELSCEARVAGVIFKGKADLLCAAEGSTPSLSLVEFKLNAVEVQGEALEERFLQAAIYYLGLQEIYRARVRYLATYVFESGAVEKVEVGQELLKRVRGLIEEAVPLSRGNEFPGKINPFCPNCGYNALCAVFNAKRKGLSLPSAL